MAKVSSFAAAAGRALRTASGKADSRKKLMGAVRAACARHGLDDDERRAMQATVTGVDSMRHMSLAQLGQLLDHLNKGWSGPMGHRAHVGKIRALWWTLYWLGAVDDPGEKAIDAFVRRQTGVGALRFLDHQKAASVIEAQKAWCARLGVRWPTAEELTSYQRSDPDLTIAHLERHAVLAELAQRLRAVGALELSYIHYCTAALKLGPRHTRWSAHELDACIKLLGKRLRRTIEQQADA